EEDAERDLEVHRDQLLDARAQHLDRHFGAGLVEVRTQPRAVDLAQARGGDGHTVELREHRVHGLAQLRGDHRLDLFRGMRRDAVLEPADRREIGLGQDVRARAEHLRELDERRAERRDGRDQPLGAALVALVRQLPAPAEQDPAPAVAQECDEEWRAPRDDREGPPPTLPSSRAEARPSRRKKPPTSVNVVTKIEDATAGSAPRRSSRMGTNAPAIEARIMLPHIASKTTKPRSGSPTHR